ncbi:MAG: hypothetical protein PHF57_09675, partial [Methanoregula sp.]|nr:hypothetical protein [Methanoregula sp.]
MGFGYTGGKEVSFTFLAEVDRFIADVGRAKSTVDGLENEFKNLEKIKLDFGKMLAIGTTIAAAGTALML